ncbi:hypothetical protein ABH926_007620 [Catenulispora sp. GP43]|uniref:fascin domain-containing protein n=1 Tax=Catenulispora sp. GP43 TaxID=3156263 RepID=UPI0035182FD3
MRMRALSFLAACALAATPWLGTASAAPAQAAQTTPAVAAAGPMWATQLQFDDNGTAWSQASFAALKAKGLTSAEIDMPWGTIEPSQNSFSFTELDQELANASAAGIKLIPIFWYSGWGGSPASWVTGREVDSSGASSPAPVWWDPVYQPAYFDYVTKTVAHIAGSAGYGGSILDYGFLDAQWDINGGASGWAQADLDEFHSTYLPNTYGTIAAFNSKYQTSYANFSAVPAAAVGQPLWGVYQAFRAWSVQDTYGRLTAAVRAVTASTPLYYYFGGHFGNAVNYANIPDIFFSLAKQYTATVIVDAAQSPGLALTFGALARAYGVPLAQEWTAPSDSTQLSAQAVQWLSNYAMGLPEGGGEDFFIHDGTQKDVVGWPIYTSWVPTLRTITGAYPQQPVAVYMDFSQAYGNTSGGAVNAMEDAISSLWDGYQAGFAVVTSQEVADGTVKLSAYKAILPMNGPDANVSAYQAAGGTVLSNGSQLASYAPAYATLANSGVLQVVPAVAASGTSATVTLADVTSGTAYNAAVTFHFAGLGMTAGSYHVVDAGGNTVPQAAVSGGICTAPNISAAQLVQWNIVAGAAPAGTPVPAACGGSSGTPVISLRAHANGDIVTADNAGAAPLIANRTAIGTWEQFDLITDSDGSVSFRAHANGDIVTAENAGASSLIANRTAIGPWEEFDLIHNSDGSVSFRAHANGDIVTAENAGAAPLIANRTAIGPWEEFDLIND